MIWSQACTDGCEQFLVMAITWAALHQFGSAKLGLVLAAWAIPRGVLLLFGGVLVDRSERRRLTAAGSVGLLALLTLACGAASPDSGELDAWIAVAIGLGVLDAVRLPVAGSMLPRYVHHDRLVDANRWNGLREWVDAGGRAGHGGILVATHRNVRHPAVLGSDCT